MNKIFKLKFSRALGVFVVVSEHCKNAVRGKGSGKKLATLVLTTACHLHAHAADVYDFVNSSGTSYNFNNGYAYSRTSVFGTIYNSGNQSFPFNGNFFTTVFSGGVEYMGSVLGNPREYNLTVSSGGNVYLEYRGVISSATILGYLGIGSSVDSASLQQISLVGGGQMFVFSGATNVRVFNLIVNNGALGFNLAGSSNYAVGTTLSGSPMGIFNGAEANVTTILSGANLNVSSGGTATNSIVSSGGLLAVSAGGTAT
ncbi:AIDA repeat-containing protein, partial [Polynucleobacter sp. Ross1-W9]|uniref:ESPR domain-containing protein n=1 Tax=Polynucleobacter parvulilacunae TaxID=1855631 RepID=UPI001C0C889E